LYPVENSKAPRNKSHPTAEVYDMKKIARKSVWALSILSVTLICTSSAALAQGDAPQSSMTDEQKLDQQIDMMRKDVRSQKKQIIAANLKLTDQEAEKFWPVYDRYTAELVQVNNTKYELIKQYAQTWNSMTDEQADKSAKEWLQLDQSVAQLRLKYLPIFRNVISPRNTALFFQLDRRIVGMIDLRMASILPLVQP
jgi:Spy/CpxP family protein refolding chaperone